MMKQHTLEEVLEDVCRLDFAEFEDPPEHHFSLRHRRNMKRILSPKREKYPPAKIKLTPKTAVVILLVIFLALFTGAMKILKLPSFSGTIYPDNTQMFATDNSSPTIIEQVYYLEALPDNYIYTEGYGGIGENFIQCMYTNFENGDILIFDQYSKNQFDARFDNDYSEIIQIEFDGYNGFIWRSKIPEDKYLTLVWDNGDYILALWCNFPENDLLNLAKSAKVSQN